MQITELSSNALLPRILLVRHYDTVAMQHQVKKRVADSYELSFYLDGTGTVSIQDARYPIEPGAVRFSKPGTVLCSTPQYRCITVYFDLGKENTLYRNPVLDALPSYTSGSPLQPLFESLLEAHLSAHPAAPLQQNAILLTLLAELYRSMYAVQEHSSAVRVCLNYMQENLSQNVTLDSLGILTGYSPLHLIRLFKQELGQTPHKWLTAIRLEHAKRLLAESDQTLEQIASACGFSSPSHFKTLFKQSTHYTPGAYRRSTRLV
jgi:AraC-like DNA-binding protein